jgi:antitoxin (DNA-binding transcriptional repressor) of toxin-antitoxin stability system
MIEEKLGGRYEMKTMAVGELKAQFSTVLTEMQDGHPVAVGFGKSKRKIAVLMPYGQYRKAAGRRLGILEGQATCRVLTDFSLSDEDVLSS